LRQRLVTVSNGSQEEYKLRQIFNDFDANKSGMLTIDELAALMAKL
jgi:Ca2+-binding EF-hand superfamily protein